MNVLEPIAPLGRVSSRKGGGGLHRKPGSRPFSVPPIRRPSHPPRYCRRAQDRVSHLPSSPGSGPLLQGSARTEKVARICPTGSGSPRGGSCGLGAGSSRWAHPGGARSWAGGLESGRMPLGEPPEEEGAALGSKSLSGVVWARPPASESLEEGAGLGHQQPPALPQSTELES